MATATTTTKRGSRRGEKAQDAPVSGADLDRLLVVDGRIASHLRAAFFAPGEKITKGASYYMDALRRQDVCDKISFNAAQYGFKVEIGTGYVSIVRPKGLDA